MPFVKILRPKEANLPPFLARLPLGEPDLHRQLGGSYFQRVNCKWLVLRLVFFPEQYWIYWLGFYIYIQVWYRLVFYQVEKFGGWRTQDEISRPWHRSILTKWGPKICQPKKSLTWNNLLNWSDKSPNSSCAVPGARREVALAARHGFWWFLVGGLASMFCPFPWE